MNNKRIIHSFSTKSLVNIQLYDSSSIVKLLGNIWYYALSYIYAKESGAKVVCYTDSLGALFLDKIPYDELHVALNDIYNDSIHYRFWACAKMKALQLETVGAVHIDGDVFLKNKELVDLIFDDKYDIVVQNFEKGTWYEHELVAYRGTEDYCLANGLDINSFGAYNTGVLGFNNKELKDNFLKGYFNIAKEISKRKKDVLDNNNFVTPDIVIEQEYVYQLSKDYNVKLLLPSKDYKEVQKQAINIGYQHVMTYRKFDNLEQVKQLVKKHNINIYNKLIKLCN